MFYIEKFTFNPFSENTYVLYNEKKQAFIIDPGMYFQEEFQRFDQFIQQKGLIPELLINTHTHLDHLFGNAHVARTYNIQLTFHAADKPVFDAASSAGALYDLPFEKSPEPAFYLKENKSIQLGEDSFEILLTPGHSPGSVCFYQATQHVLISGDVLFQMSVGRTDLPGGNAQDLYRSITNTLFSLPNETTVYSGHGPETSIGFEKQNNPFVK